MKTIKDTLNDFIAKFAADNEFYSVVGRVVEVNENNKTCIVQILETGATIPEVLLQSYAGAEYGLFLIPELESIVTISFFNKDQAYITKTSDLKALKIIFEEGTTIEAIKEKLIFNGGKLGGLVLINELTEKLNDLVKEITDLKTSLDSHVHTGVTTGAGSSGPPASIVGTFNNFTADDYENKNIIQ